MSRLTLTFIGSLVGVVFAVVAGLPSAAVAQEAYKLRSGDTIIVEVLEDASLNRQLLVAPDGRVSLPLAGNLRAAGRSLEEVQAALAAQLAPNFAQTPTVFVGLLAQRPANPNQVARTIDVFVMGEAERPGRLEVQPGTIVLQLFAEMGGFTPFAATKRVQLRRGEQTITLNYRDIEAGTSNSGMLTLQDGDVLVIPQRRLFE